MMVIVVSPEKPVIVLNSDSFQFFVIFYHQREFTLGVIFRNIQASKMQFFFMDFDLALQFQGHLLQDLDGPPPCDNFGENFMKSS